jgi:hypothetical protein
LQGKLLISDIIFSLGVRGATVRFKSEKWKNDKALTTSKRMFSEEKNGRMYPVTCEGREVRKNDDKEMRMP